MLQTIGALLALFISIAPLVHADKQSTCTAVSSVQKCVSSIQSVKTRTASASSFCSSVLGCTTTPTITLEGTVTSTSTVVVVESYTFEELVTYTSVPYTEVSYVAIPTTQTILYTSTIRSSIFSTTTKTEKCTSSASTANPSFYLRATNVPVDDINNKYVQAYPYYFAFSTQRKVAFTPTKDLATLFTLDSKGRLITPSTDGTLYGHIDYFNDFQIFSFVPREIVQSRNYIYAECRLEQASGKWEGGFKELRCSTQGTWPASVFYYDRRFLTFDTRPGMALADDYGGRGMVVKDLAPMTLLGLVFGDHHAHLRVLCQTQVHLSSGIFESEKLVAMGCSAPDWKGWPFRISNLLLGR
ncbi:hypothetical protein VTL71DRAFT_1112 [Oculimacula yallundae]|uniref:GON domain-containing protein n=1 Tax=Oculimacula yallundae TaxID=86028 RepID=A0ABR4D257_9HELO